MYGHIINMQNASRCATHSKLTSRTNRHNHAELASRPHAYINAPSGVLQSVKSVQKAFLSFGLFVSHPQLHFGEAH